MNRLAKFLALLGLASLAPPAFGQMGGIAEIRDAWDACTAVKTADPDGWKGWRRDFDNGYGDNFSFWDNSANGQASMLERSFAIDAIAIETVTSCFRTDGSLAFVFVTMNSPNMAAGGESGPAIERQGRIYVGPNGKVVQVLGRIVDDKGKKIAFLDDSKASLARPCDPVDLHRTLDDVSTEYFSVLGEIDGAHPNYKANDFDWCAAAKEQD